MIFGLGTDIVEIARIEKAIAGNNKFAARILTNFEINEYENSKQKGRYLAKKFAVKEALVKAMGTGIGNGVGWQMAQVEHTQQGQPYLSVSGAIEAFFIANKIVNCKVSISDAQHYAVATVLLETATLS